VGIAKLNRVVEPKAYFIGVIAVLGERLNGI
jgi:hypothetical protein